MNFHDIQAFLAIVKYGTISKAADELYISQTAVTRRLKTLEDELGIPLLDRGRGIKESTLTPSGRDFLSIAQRWNAVWEETQRFKSLGERLSLSIGSVQILNDYVFPALYSRLLTHSPGMNLYIHTEHAIEWMEGRDGFSARSELTLQNAGESAVESVTLYLNPGLTVERVEAEGRAVPFEREGQALVLRARLEAGMAQTFDIHYGGKIDERVCYLHVADEQYRHRQNGTDPKRHHQDDRYAENRHRRADPLGCSRSDP